MCVVMFCLGAVHKRDLAEIISVESQLDLQPEGECPYVTNWPLKLLFKSNRDDPSNIYCAPNNKITASDLTQYYKNDFTVRIGEKSKPNFSNNIDNNNNNNNINNDRYGDDNENSKTLLNRITVLRLNEKNNSTSSQENSETLSIKNEVKTKIKSNLNNIIINDNANDSKSNTCLRSGSRRGGGEKCERERERDKERERERERERGGIERGSERGSERGGVGGSIKKKVEVNYVTHRRRGGSSRNRRTENIPERRTENIPERRTENIPERRTEKLVDENNDGYKMHMRHHRNSLPTNYIALID